MADTPTLLHAFEDSDWSYYVAGHDTEALFEIDEPTELESSELWMQPVRASTLDFYDGPTTTRDADGKFKPVVCWMECGETDRGAQPFLGVRYRPRDRGPGEET